MTTRRPQKIGAMASLDFHDSYLVHLHIKKTQSWFTADILAEGCFKRIPIRMTPDDLADLNDRLREALESIARTSVDRRDTAIANLAKIGHIAFRRVFREDDDQKAIRELLEPIPGSRIQVSSERFFLPWDLIYPVSLDEPLSYEHFWGMRHVVSRLIRPGNPFPLVIPFDDRPTLGLLTCLQLPSVQKKVIPFFEELRDEDKKIFLLRLRPLDPNEKRKELDVFRDFWKEPFEVAHFACHATYETIDPSLSSIRLSRKFSISLDDLEAHPFKAEHHPLIVMNACGTGALSPLYTAALVEPFLRYGARGVVATECDVTDSFAADFAKQLYHHLLEGKPLGDSLLAARRHFLAKGNPSGLLYSMYAPYSLRLVQTKGQKG